MGIVHINFVFKIKNKKIKTNINLIKEKRSLISNNKFFEIKKLDSLIISFNLCDSKFEKFVLKLVEKTSSIRERKTCKCGNL